MITVAAVTWPVAVTIVSAHCLEASPKPLAQADERAAAST